MTFLVFAWGVSEACMAASKDHRGIYVTRYASLYNSLADANQQIFPWSFRSWVRSFFR